MSSKRRIRHAAEAHARRACHGKIAHESQTSAVGAIKSMERRRDDRGLRTYLCEHCKRWHVGHLTIRRRRKPR